MQGASLLKLEAQCPGVHRFNASLLCRELASQQLEQDLFEADVEVQRQVHLHVFERGALEDMVVEDEAPLSRSDSDEQVREAAVLPANVLEASLLLCPKDSKLLHVCSDVVHRCVVLLSEGHNCC